MTDMNETPSWDDKIQIIGRTERVSGGQDGVANRPLKQLANRTQYLKQKTEQVSEQIEGKVGAVVSFDDGGVLQSPLDEIIYQNLRLVWTGQYPKVVIAGSTPESSGGIGAGAWAYSSDAFIRESLAQATDPSHVIGNFFGGEGLDVCGAEGISLKERLLARGQFGVVQGDGEPPYLAGMVYGDSRGNLGAFTTDARGRLSTHAVSDGRITASGIGYPYCELTGHSNGQFPNVMMRTYSPLTGDDNLMPGLMWVWDKTARKTRLMTVSPLNPGNDGYPVDGYDEHVNLLASFYDIGYGLNQSFDHFFTKDTGALQWGRLCIIKPGTSGGAIKKFTALITAGSYVNYEQSTFLLEVNGQNLIDTIIQGRVGRDNIEQWVKFNRLSDSSLEKQTAEYIPEVGVRVNQDTGFAEVYLKVPYYSPRVSVTVLAASNPQYVETDWNEWKQNKLSIAEPGGLIYTQTRYPINTQNYIKTSGGVVVYAPLKVMRVRDKMTTSSTYSRMDQYLESGFTAYSDYHAVNKFSGAGTHVYKQGTGTYKVTGCTLSSKWWKIKPPVNWWSGSDSGVVAIISSASGEFVFTLKDADGKLIDIPDGTWIDFHVSL
jgi:hypothetical protein